MKSLISINNKFMKMTPNYLVDKILSTKYVKGVEAYINYLKEDEMKYLDDLVFLLKKDNLILQIHADIKLDYENQVKYMKKIEEISDYLGYPITVTIHSVYDDDKNLSIMKTIEYLSNLLSVINNDKITLCLENLNDAKELDRLEKEVITPIILNDDRLYFTYDIGHELEDFSNITNVNPYLIEEIRNVHLHTSNNKGIGHMPIYENDCNFELINKALSYLIVNHYDNNISYEYDLYYCKGETDEEKLDDFLKSIDYVSERYS